MTVVLAGGSGGLGSATARILAAEGFDLVISYKSNRERAERLSDIGRIVQADLSFRGRSRPAARFRRKLLWISDLQRSRRKDARFRDCMHCLFPNQFSGTCCIGQRGGGSHEVRRNPRGDHPHLDHASRRAFYGIDRLCHPKGGPASMPAGSLRKSAGGRTDIRVNVICPGVNQAGMAEASIASGKYTKYLEDDVIPRYGRAEDVARAVRFFLEPDNYITGQVLTVDGGLTL